MMDQLTRAMAGLFNLYALGNLSLSISLAAMIASVMKPEVRAVAISSLVAPSATTLVPLLSGIVVAVVMYRVDTGEAYLDKLSAFDWSDKTLDWTP